MKRRYDQELWSKDEQSKEKMNQLQQNFGWQLNDTKLNQLRMKMNKTMNDVPMMSNSGTNDYVQTEPKMTS